MQIGRGRRGAWILLGTAPAQRNGALSRAGSFLRSSSGQAVAGRRGVRGAGADYGRRRGLVISDVAGSRRTRSDMGSVGPPVPDVAIVAPRRRASSRGGAVPASRWREPRE